MSENQNPSADVTRLLHRVRDGDDAALSDLMEILYPELRRLAHRQRAKWGAEATRTTGLVHEAYLRLVGANDGYQDRKHFFATAATAMRHILVDQARTRRRRKRGGDWQRTTMGEGPAMPDDVDLVLAVHKLLAGLAEVDPRLVTVVECQFYAGLTGRETAEVLGLSTRTVRRMWRAAQVWMQSRLEGLAGAEPADA